MTSRSDRRRSHPTQADVARLAGVSQATVSYVLNRRQGTSVPAKTQERIFEAVRTLGYVRNQVARSLRTNETRTIACIIPDITNPFYPAFARGIQDTAEQHGYDLVMYNTDGVAEKERRCLGSVRASRVDGVVLVAFHLEAEDYARLLMVNIPAVVVGQAPQVVCEYPLDSISVDQAAAARAAVEYLIERGHKRIGIIAGAEGVFAHEGRLDGYRQALSRHALPIDDALISAGDFTERGGYQAMQALLARGVRPTAVFAVNDLAATGAMLALKEAGLAVPGDVAVVGFDDIPSARLVSPPLTTISQEERGLGRRAVEMLLARLDGQGPEEGIVEQWPFRLVLRDSA